MARLAIYPGSFDPPTHGHLDVIERGARLVDELIVAVGVNSEKQPFLSADDRVAVLKECCAGMKTVKVAQFEGLLISYAQAVGAKVIVRGLRAVTDFDYEFRIAMANRTLAPDVETVFLVARDEYSFLASSVVRDVAKYGGDLSPFVPEPVSRLILGRSAGGSHEPGAG